MTAPPMTEKELLRRLPPSDGMERAGEALADYFRSVGFLDVAREVEQRIQTHDCGGGWWGQ